MKLKLGDSNDKDKDSLIGYADADWAQNKVDRKSNSGFLFKFNGATISWTCKKQDCVALSSTEAEYIALAEATQEGAWIRQLLNDFGQTQRGATKIFEDNQGCLKLIANKRFSNRTKHISTKFHYVRDLKDKRIVFFEYCPTEFMLADMLTKPLNTNKLTSFRKQCGLN